MAAFNHVLFYLYTTGSQRLVTFKASAAATLKEEATRLQWPRDTATPLKVWLRTDA